MDPSTFQTGLSSDSASTSSNSTQWDVFLSFRGPDTRMKFTNYLYNVLELHGLRPFRDNPELRTGEKISDALKEAIRNSKTYVVVFSENYASSPWCLEELVEIYKCCEEKKRLVIGVYYHIHPLVVRHQNESFKTAFEKHETGRFSDKIDQVNQWRYALRGVADFSGHTISPESDNVDIINEIARAILQHVKPKTLHVADHFVARRILQLIKNEITAALSHKTVKGVIKIGLHGLGGVGKTTLAKALYNHLLETIDLDASCFLADVREAFGRPNGLVSLQNQLISAFVKSKTKDEVYNEDQGTEFIKQRFGLTKVLLFIDDVDKFEQCKSLMGPFAPGSVVIITTRDTTILDKIQVEPSHQFEVNVMNDAEALKLFTAHAFPNAEPDEILMKLFGDDILSLAGSLPLALQVFGSHLFKESKKGWKDYINTMMLDRNSTILDRLKISLNSMDAMDNYPRLKDIFIDIACFFNGVNVNEAIKMMEKYYPVDVDHNIRILRKRSLLTINFNDELGMHDLLRDMGWQAARNKFPRDEPENHTRLWVLDDICDVLEQQKGGKAIEGIIPSNFYYGDALKTSEFTTDTFKNMSKLRFLYIKDVKLTGRFEQIFGSLKWLYWECCPFTELPPHFRPRKLVVLELPNSSIIKWELKKDFEYLKTLDMSNSLSLTTLPDFSKLPNLETLNLTGCQSLEMFDISDGWLTKLVSLNLSRCVNLRSLCDRYCSLKALEVLVVPNCKKLESLPDNLWEITSFRELSASNDVLGSVPVDSIFRFPFKELSAWRTSLSTLPSSMSQLSNLERVSFRYSPNLVSIEQLPRTIKRLYLSGCKALKNLPNLSDFKQLQKLYIFSCNGVKEIVGLEGLTSLIKLACDSYLVGYTSMMSLFKIRSQNAIIHRGWFPDWIRTCDNMWDHTLIAPDVQHNFLGIMFCLEFEDPVEGYEKYGEFTNSVPSYYDHVPPPWCNIRNSTTGENYGCEGYEYYSTRMIIIIPSSIISVTRGDKIVANSEAVLLRFRLMYDD